MLCSDLRVPFTEWVLNQTAQQHGLGVLPGACRGDRRQGHGCREMTLLWGVRAPLLKLPRSPGPRLSDSARRGRRFCSKGMVTRDSPSGPFRSISGPGGLSTRGGGQGLCVMGTPVPPVLAVDVFDKLNFTGAHVPRLEHLRGEVPRDLESSVFFSEDFFKPAERKGKADETWGLPRGPAAGGGEGAQPAVAPTLCPAPCSPAFAGPEGKAATGVPYRNWAGL